MQSRQLQMVHMRDTAALLLVVMKCLTPRMKLTNWSQITPNLIRCSPTRVSICQTHLTAGRSLKISKT